MGKSELTIEMQKNRMLQALEASIGIVTTAAKAAGITRSTHYDWMKSDPEYKKEVDSLSDMALDFAESNLFKQIRNGIPSTTIFYLKTKGKKRGYIERVEIDDIGEDDEVNTTLDV